MTAEAINEVHWPDVDGFDAVVERGQYSDCWYKYATKRCSEAQQDLQRLETEERSLAAALVDFDARHNAQLEQVELAMKDVCMTESAQHMYEKFREKSSSKGACQFCRRTFITASERSLFEQSVGRLTVKIPSFLAESNRRLTEARDEFRRLDTQRPRQERLEELRSILPLKRRAIEEAREQQLMARACAMQVDLANSFRALLDSSELSDVTIAVGDVRISAHQAILAARSPVFAAMLRSPMMENASRIMTLDDLSEKTVRQLLRFLYTGSLARPLDDGVNVATLLEPPTDEVDIMALLQAAHRFEVPLLVDICERAMTTRLNLENAAEVLQTAEMVGCDSLKEASLAFIIDHVAEVQTTEGFKHLAEKHPGLMLRILAGVVPPVKRRRTD